MAMRLYIFLFTSIRMLTAITLDKLMVQPILSQFIHDVILDSPPELDIMLVLYGKQTMHDVFLTNEGSLDRTRSVMISSIDWLKEKYDEDERRRIQTRSRRQFFYLLFLDNSQAVSEFTESLQQIRTFDFQSPIVIITRAEIAELAISRILEKNIYQTHVMSQERMFFGIQSFCAYCNGGKHSFIKTNSWTYGSGFRKSFSLPASFKKNFNNALIKCGNIPILPHRYARKTNDGKTVWDGIEYNSFMAIMTAMNARVEFLTPADREWGRIHNGSWTGLVGQLIRKEVDIAGMPLILNYLRNKYTSTTPLLENLETAFISAKPQLAPQWQAVVRPFTWLVWLLLFCTAILSAITYFYIIKYNPQDFKKLPLQYCIFDMFRILSSEAIDDRRPSWARFIHVGTYMLLTSVVIYSYTGTLLSHITMPVYLDKPVDSTEDIKSRPGMKWLVPSGQAIGNTFNADPEMLQRRSNVPIKEAFKMIAEEPDKYVFFNGVGALRGTIFDEWLDPYGEHIFHLSESRWIIAIVWLLQKESPFVDDLNNRIHRFQAGGLWVKGNEDAYEILEFKGKERAKKLGVKPYYPVKDIRFTFQNMLGALVVMGVGTLCAVLAFAVEFIIGIITKKPTNETWNGQA